MIKRFIFCFFCFCCFQVFTIPKGKNVVSGEARDVFQSNQNFLKISTSDKAVIHWDSFSIKDFEKVVFDMPKNSSAVLNRVVGRLKSSILGSLQSNGNVFLINPQGILIGKDACIDVNSFLASTFDVLDEKFLKNEDMVFSGDSKEKIINLGTIKALDGDVILLGRIVENSGVLEAKSGNVCIGVGKEILLKPMDKERIYIKPLLEDEKEDIGIENTGEILAKNVEMKADGNFYSLAIKNSGKVDAYSLVEKGGRILLEAKDGRVETDGSLVAKREKGGEIHVLGKEVGLLNEAYLDTSSDRGGGEILIGGDYKGENENIYNAKAVFVSTDAVIKANANLEGAGGKVIFWADEAMNFYGTVFATGGEVKGDGGFIEISSGGDYFGYFGRADAKAYNGKSGKILFDPVNIVIKSATSDPTYIGNPNFPNYYPPPGTATLNTADLVATLPSNNVEVSVVPGGGGTISLEDDLTAEGNLTLTAPNGTIFFNNLYTISSGASPFTCKISAEILSVSASGVSSTGAGIRALGNNNIEIDCEKVLIGDGTAGSGRISTSSGHIRIKNCKLLEVTSLFGSSAFINSGTGALEINLNESPEKERVYFRIESISSSSGSAEIRSDGGSININFKNSSSENLIKTIGNGVANIFTSDGANINLNCGDLTIKSDQVNAGIFAIGDITFDVNNLSITSEDAVAGIFASAIENSNIDGKANYISLTSKNAEAAIKASGGEIFLYDVGNINLTASGSADCCISCLDSLNIQGVDNITMNPVGGKTFIETTGGGALDINSLSSPGSGSIKLNPSFDNFASYIASDAGGDVKVYFSGNSSFRAANSYSGIFSGKNSGTGSIDFYSGNLTIRGGTGTNSFAGIHAKGEVTFGVGDLNMLGGSGGAAQIYAEGENIESSFTTNIDLTSNVKEASIVAGGIIDITNAGYVIMTANIAPCRIECQEDLSIQGVNSLEMFPTSNDVFIKTTNGGAVNINSLSSPGSGGINLNQNFNNFASYIASDAGGDVKVYFSGNSFFKASNSYSGIFSGKSSGTGSIDFYSGDLTIQGGTGTNSFAKIHAKGGVSFKVGDLNMIGGSEGVAQIYAEGGNIENSSTTNINLTSNTKEASIVAGKSIDITNAGDVIMTANGTSCRIECLETLDMQGVNNLKMYPTSNDVFIKTTGGGAVNINSMSSPGSGGINLNPDASNFLSYIATDQGGDIDVNFSGTSSFTAGTSNSGIFSGKNSGNGSINFSSGDLTVTGGTGVGTSLAGIFSGYQSETFAGSGDIFMDVGNLTLKAGSGSGVVDKHNAEIRAGSGSGLVLINASGEVNLFGGSGNNCSSYIRGGSAALGLVNIIANKILLNSHSSSTTSEAAIKSASGIVFITTNGDVYVKANAAPSYIERLNTMYCGNDLILESNNNEAYIEAVTGSTPLIDVTDDLKLIAIGADAKIYVSSPDIIFNIGEDLILSAQNSTGDFLGAFIDGTNAIFNVGRNVELFGNDNTFAGFAEISFSDNISIHAGRVELQGGSSTVSGAFAAIESTGGNLDLATNFGGVDLIGGRKSGSHAALKASGVMDLYVRGTLDMQATQAGESFIEANSFSGFLVIRTLKMLGSNDNAYIKSLIGTLNVTAGEDIFLNGNARIENSTGPLSLIAGNNMYIRNLSIVKNTGGEDVTLVVDNDYPVSPERGHGHFIFEGNSIIEDGKVRIFTVERDFDTISGNINGVPYVPGIEFEDSNQERWGVYYPNSFFGGPGFTIFYKNTGDSHHDKGLEYVAFASAELFYRLNNMKVDFDILDLYDRYIKRSKKYLVDYLYDNNKNEKNKLERLELK